MSRFLAITFLANLLFGQLCTVPVAFAMPQGATDTIVGTQTSSACEEEERMSRVAHHQRLPCPTDHCLDVADPSPPDDVASTGNAMHTEVTTTGFAASTLYVDVTATMTTLPPDACPDPVTSLTHITVLRV